MFKPALAAFGLVLVAGTPALAQESTADRPFDGVYVGVAGGYDVQPNDIGSSILFDRNLDGRFGDSVTTATGANAFSPGFCNGAALGATPAAGCRNDRDGWAYYGRVGADTQRGNLVIGAVGEFGRSEVRDSVSGFSTTPASYTMTRSIDWEASVRGRVGYAVDATLFYGTFGTGYARIDRSFSTTNTANAFTGRGDRNQFGLLGGGGIEQKVGRNLSFGLEYMYHQYRDNDYRVQATAGTAPATNPFVLAPNIAGTDFRRSDSMFRWHSMRATAAFRF
ncbi:outer membrane immunogenic protein [Sphingomonas gellani]|uniref:Outer membrane immunogenic protein n=1 Tax=Sphingomonas gellani TaxID=1166340 RepID=A0A1H7YRC3_9SPHN|nr:outer membrane beta-barrel protein [Sphingomonas gellani]SEM48782.1 outer membrane immunogenic protein [Sphingomonas gellani]